MNNNTCGQRTKEERRAWLKQAQGYPLKLKVELTKARIREWYTHFDGKVYVAYSGGKDSEVMLDLVRSLYPDVPAVFANTGNELDSVLENVRRHGDGITWVKPKMSFEEVVRKWGYPVVSKKTARMVSDLRLPKGQREASKRLYWDGIKQDGTLTKSFKLAKKWRKLVDAPFNTTNKCCGILKINPTKPYEKETGRVPFVGTMASESASRNDSFLRGGCNAFDMGDQASRPIMFWTEQDILQYITENNLPIAKAYGDILPQIDGTLRCSGDQRTGCKFCLFGVHLEKGENRIQRLARVEHESYRYAIEELGYDKVMDFLGVDWRPYVEPDMQTDMFDARFDVPVEELEE